jgi:hypothetical protein
MGAAVPIALTGAQMFQQYKSGKNQADAIKEAAAYQAKIQEINAIASKQQAADALFRGEESANAYRGQVRKLEGEQRAGFAASGVDVSSGSAAKALADTAEFGELDAITIKRNAIREAHGIKVDAANAGLAGVLYQRAAATNARASLATGGLQALGTLGAGINNYYQNFR